jgi:internalin A
MTKVFEKIKASIEKNKDYLDLSNLGLEEIPIELKSALNLKRINLSYNNIEELPYWFSDLIHLENLDFRYNKLTKLIPDLRKLVNLTSINLRNNLFEDIPIELRELGKLIFVSFSSNQISIVPEWFFKIPSVNIDNNPIVDPPIEIYSRGYQAILNYFKEREKGTENLYEAKLLIVGEAGAGKTSLMNKILDENYPLNPFEASTKGIEIKPYYFHTEDKNYFRINIWDFGGQEIYHATHQFFLTKRSLYILLADDRAENTDFNYWLQTIELLSGNSPLLIVQNEKQDRKKDINAEGMRERFKNITARYSFN